MLSLAPLFDLLVLCMPHAPRAFTIPSKYGLPGSCLSTILNWPVILSGKTVHVLVTLLNPFGIGIEIDFLKLSTKAVFVLAGILFLRGVSLPITDRAAKTDYNAVLVLVSIPSALFENTDEFENDLSAPYVRSPSVEHGGILN